MSSTPKSNVNATTDGMSFRGNATYSWRGPESSCEYNIYTPSTMKQCLAQHYPKVMIIGDSRGRQIYSAMKPLLTNTKRPFTMFDSARDMADSNILHVNGTDITIGISDFTPKL